MSSQAVTLRRFSVAGMRTCGYWQVCGTDLLIINTGRGWRVTARSQATWLAMVRDHGLLHNRFATRRDAVRAVGLLLALQPAPAPLTPLTGPEGDLYRTWPQIGEHLRELRERAGLSAADLVDGDRILDVTEVSTAESGGPTASGTLAAICDRLGVTVDDVLVRDDLTVREQLHLAERAVSLLREADSIRMVAHLSRDEDERLSPSDLTWHLSQVRDEEQLLLDLLDLLDSPGR